MQGIIIVADVIVIITVIVIIIVVVVLLVMSNWHTTDILKALSCVCMCVCVAVLLYSTLDQEDQQTCSNSYFKKLNWNHSLHKILHYL